MKKRKIACLIAAMATLFSLAGCASGTQEVTFDYNDNTLTMDGMYQLENFVGANDTAIAYLEDSDDEYAQVMLKGIENVHTTIEECGDFRGYVSKDDGSVINATINQYYQDQDSEGLLNLIGSVDKEITEENGNVILRFKAAFADRNAEIQAVYEENPAYAYSKEMYGEDVASFKLKELTVTPEYSMKEIMGKAGANTLMGMGTVFLVLIFISIIIGQFEKIGKLQLAITNWNDKRKNKKTAEKAESGSQTVAAPAASSENLVGDEQLVAVITAAILAAGGSTQGADGLVVRSIRKAKR